MALISHDLDKKIKQAAEIIKQGGVVIYPTDTAYAIGCLYDNKTAIKKILNLKKRKDSKFTLIASSLKQVENFFSLNKYEKKLAKQHWPGPLSIAVTKNSAIRVPNNTIARSLARRVGKPIIATSLNYSGNSMNYSLSTVNKGLLASFPKEAIIDIGKLKSSPASTVIEYTNKKFLVHRYGAIKL